MKKLILVCSLLCSVIALTAKAQVTKCPLFDHDEFGNAGAWTVVDPITGNGSIQITGAAITFSNNNECATNLGACNGREMRVYRPVPTLSNTSWRAECKFRITNGNGVSHGLMGFTAGTQDPAGGWAAAACPAWKCGGQQNSCSSPNITNQDGIFASIIAFGNPATPGVNTQIPNRYDDQPFNQANQTYDVNHAPSANNPPNLGWRIYGHAKHNGGPVYQSPIAASNIGPLPNGYIDSSRGIELPALNTDYYLRLERLSSGECKISVFSDSSFLNHIPGSPQCFKIEPEIKGLNTVQNFVYVTGSFYRSITGKVMDLKVFNECPETPPSCSGTPTPTVTVTPTPTATISPTPIPGCAQVTGEARCLPNGGYSYTFNVINNSGNPISQILLTPAQGSTFTLSPQLTNLSSPLNNGQSTTVTTTISNVKPGDKVCFFVSLMSEKAACCIVQVCPILPRCEVIDYPTPGPSLVPGQVPRGRRRP